MSAGSSKKGTTYLKINRSLFCDLFPTINKYKIESGLKHVPRVRKKVELKYLKIIKIFI